MITTLKYHLVIAVLISVQALFAQSKYQIDIDVDASYQRMDNFGAAGCWFAEGVGKDWSEENREQMAQLLFSQEMDEEGNPKGIGLSAWRFNIGGGTFEQGEKSGISDFRKRVECFQNPDGTYDWSKQEGYVWFTKKAKEYGVENLIAFSNTPPVQFNRNNLGFKTDEALFTNLKEDKFDDYADFLATVLQHFEEDGLKFDYVSPVNEPQWNWFGEFGKAKQEGNYWTNADIARITKLLDQYLSDKKLETKIILTESARLDYIYDGEGKTHHQAKELFSPESDLYIGNLTHLKPIIAAHSYMTDTPDDEMISIRQKVKKETNKRNIEYWQSEYSMLGNGFREGKEGKISTMDCALFLSKVIHFDITEANATAWQFWNSMEPGSPDYDTRYYFFALQPNDDYTDGTFQIAKTLWAMGHYSLFVRPGMQRIAVHSGLTPLESAQELMVSAYSDEENKKLVVILINYKNEDALIEFNDEDLNDYTHFQHFLTTKDSKVNLKKIKDGKPLLSIQLPERSISTLVFNQNKHNTNEQD